MIICKDIAALVDPYVVAFDMPLNEVALEMAKRHIGSAIVLHHEKLAGILSATDICRILAEIFENLNFHLAPEMTRHNAHEV